jgi:hypothetical protein
MPHFGSQLAQSSPPHGPGRAPRLDSVEGRRRHGCSNGSTSLLARPAAVPAIVISGYVSYAARQDALAAGAWAYLTKPFAAAAFTALVEQILAAPSGAPSPHPIAPEANAPHPTVGAAIAFAHDDEILRLAGRGTPVATLALPDGDAGVPSISRGDRGGGPP